MNSYYYTYYSTIHFCEKMKVEKNRKIDLSNIYAPPEMWSINLINPALVSSLYGALVDRFTDKLTSYDVYPHRPCPERHALIVNPMLTKNCMSSVLTIFYKTQHRKKFGPVGSVNCATK